MWSTHTVGYHQALKRQEILTHATAWMKLEAILLSEKSQTQKRQILYGFTYMRYLE